MPTKLTDLARLDVRVSADLKRIIEQAAAQRGQSVREFAVVALADTANAVMRDQHVTELSRRDRDRFVALLDNANAKPNRQLRAAANKYRKQLG